MFRCSLSIVPPFPLLLPAVLIVRGNNACGTIHLSRRLEITLPAPRQSLPPSFPPSTPSILPRLLSLLLSSVTLTFTLSRLSCSIPTSVFFLSVCIYLSFTFFLLILFLISSLIHLLVHPPSLPSILFFSPSILLPCPFNHSLIPSFPASLFPSFLLRS